MDFRDFYFSPFLEKANCFYIISNLRIDDLKKGSVSVTAGGLFLSILHSRSIMFFKTRNENTKTSEFIKFAKVRAYIMIILHIFDGLILQSFEIWSYIHCICTHVCTSMCSYSSQLSKCPLWYQWYFTSNISLENRKMYILFSTRNKLSSWTEQSLSKYSFLDAFPRW